MDEDVEMDNFNEEDITRRRLLEPPEVDAVQPDKERQQGSDSPKEQKKGRQRVPLDEEQISPVEADSINRRLHCADESLLDRYHDRDSFDYDDDVPRVTDEELVPEPALDRIEPPDIEVCECSAPALERRLEPDIVVLERLEPDIVPDGRAEEPALERHVSYPPMPRRREPALERHVSYPPMPRRREPALESRMETDNVEDLIVPENTDGNVDRQKDLKEDENRLSMQDRIDFENEMDEILEAEDLEDIQECITPQKLTKCATNCLEKSLEVSHTLKSLADAKGPDADDLCALGTSVEEFAVQLLEPLKSDDLKRAIFKGEDFDRVSDKAVKYRQKKFVSHPVVYNLLTRQRWMGDFYQMRYGRNWFKWFLINFWTFFDVFLFPVVHVLLWVIHLIIEFAKKRQELRVVFLFNASWKYADVQLYAMQITAKYIMQKIQSQRTQFATITRDGEGSIHTTLTSSVDAIKMPDVKDVKYHTREVSKDKDIMGDVGFLGCLKIAKNLFEDTEDTKKVLVVMTDDKLGAPSTKPLKSIKEDQNVKVISVGLGVHPEIKELETMATSKEYMFLIFNEGNDADEKKNDDILECIKEKDIYDRYVQYFNTPYFIFFRDTLSYLALLGLHFAMCLQPSTLHFTAVEWIISVFFLGRLMMEINQLIMEKNSDWAENKVRSQQEHATKEKSNEKQEEEEQEEDSTSADQKDEEKRQEKQQENNKKTQELKKLWRIISSYFDDWWNILDVVTLIVFLVIVGLRAFIWSQHSSVSKNRLLAVAGYLYGLNAMFLTLRVFGHIMESIKSTGSIQIALFQIISAVVAIFGQFLAATVAFSLAITKIYVAEVSYNSGTNSTSSGLCGSQNGINCWWSFTRHLTWSLLGIAELDPLESSDDTSDLLAKILYGLFLIMGVVMLMNLMIALLSNTYQHVEDNSFYEWSYKKATTIRTYSKYHPVPVPFNIISLSYILIRYICRKIICIKCCNAKPKKDQDFQTPMLQMTAETPSERFEVEKKRTRKEKPSLFDSLVEDLQADYFAVYGYCFPMADDSKMDKVLKETEGCHRMIGHIAQRAFRYDQGEEKRLQSHGNPEWDTKGIEVVGQRLAFVSCQCRSCADKGEAKHHGAKYLNPLSKEYPEFEVLIQESGERRFVAIGVVTKNYETHKFPGWAGNTAGYHIDDGKIFDSAHSKLGEEGDDAMAYRGDLIGCKILYGKQKDGKLPVSFTLNGRVVGEAKLTYHVGFSSDAFYPYVGIGCKGISLLFRMCPKVSLPREDTDPVHDMLKIISEQQRLMSGQLQMMNERQSKLEWKLDRLSRSLAQ